MTEPARGGDGRPAYLIALRHLVVAQDIGLTIADFDPGAQIVTAVSAAEALPALDGVERLAVAFVSEAPEAFGGSPLAQEIAARGGRAVLIGEAAEKEGAKLGFDVLARPFSTTDILAHLSGGGS